MLILVLLALVPALGFERCFCLLLLSCWLVPGLWVVFLD